MDNIKTYEIETTADYGMQLLSYIALPENTTDQSNVPGILVAPEWWGNVEYPREVAERLARAGFAAITMDIYGEGKLTSDANQANEWMQQMLADPEKLMGRCRAILNDFSDQMPVDGDNLGAIGFCFGGKIVLDMARAGMPLKAVATFHGNPEPMTPAKAGIFKADVLVAHGADDSMVSMDAIEGLEKELDNADVNYEVDVYKNAKHGFSNPDADKRAAENNIDLGYNETAANESWNKMIKFMREKLQNHYE